VVVVPKASLLRVGLFFVSLVSAAFGAPDRGIKVCLAAIFIGYVGLFYLLKSVRKHRFFLAFLWAIGVYSVQLGWLSTTNYHGIGIVFVYVVIVIFFALQFASVFTLSIQSGLALASLWTLVEWSRLYYFCGFPFSPVGLLLTATPVTMQIASIFGVYALSFFVIYLSFELAYLRIKTSLITGFFLILFGIFHMQFWEKSNKKEPFYKVALVQTGLTVEEKEEISLEEQWNRVFSFLAATQEKQFDLIVLPEVAFMNDKTESISHIELSKKLAKLYNSEIVIGLIEKDFNAAFHISPDRQECMRYEKRVLVPLAEYLPFKGLKNFLEPYGITSFFSPGETAKVFSGKIPIAPSICYEEGFAHLICQGRRAGATILVNLSNDGWFPSSRLHEEHFNLGRVRSIENGAFVLRACNTGITSVIDPFGRVLAMLKERDERGNLNSGVQTALINCYSYPTIFIKFGNTIIVSFCSLCLLAIFLIKRKSSSRVLT
jgi:apolipoprotein N-acyltransferase